MNLDDTGIRGLTSMGRAAGALPAAQVGSGCRGAHRKQQPGRRLVTLADGRIDSDEVRG